MKHNVLTIAAVLMAGTMMVSCNSASKLAGELSGAWAGVPERLFDAGASSATVIETYSFVPVDSVKDGGNVMVTALMSVTAAVSGTPGIAYPVTVTASGYATINGTWTALSHDKIDLRLDQSTLNVSVDPEAVLVSTDMEGNSDSANLTSLRPQLATSIRSQLQHAVSEHYRPQQILDHVSVIDGRTLKFKIDKASYTLSRQPD